MRIVNGFYLRDIYTNFGQGVDITEDFNWFTDGNTYNTFNNIGCWFLNYCVDRIGNNIGQNMWLEFDMDYHPKTKI